MRNQVFKKLFSVLLALIMVAGLLPASVLAEVGTAADVETTPAPTETVQPTEPAEPTAPTETETPEVTEVPEPTPENPAATEPAATDEPAAEPTPAADPTEEVTIAPVNEVAAQAATEISYVTKIGDGKRLADDDTFYRIFLLDCGRKYFTVDEIKGIINLLADNHYTHIELAFGNEGLRFLLDDMSLNVNGVKYESDAVSTAIKNGNTTLTTGSSGELSQTDMDNIIAHAKEKGIGVIPLFNAPGHMYTVVTAMEKLGLNANSIIVENAGNGKTANVAIDPTNANAVYFVQALTQKYVNYFSDNGCKFFNIGADESGINASNYSAYAQLVNSHAAMVQNAGMVAMAFNDGIYNPKYTSSLNGVEFDSNIVISYWTYSELAKAEELAKKGFIINSTHNNWYYVLGKNNSEYFGYNNAINNMKTVKCNSVDSGYTTENGCTLAVWCDYPGRSYNDNSSNVASLISTFATQNPTYFKAEEVKTPAVTIDANATGNAKAESTKNDNEYTVTVKKDGTSTIQLKAENMGDSVTWTSGDDAIATVENGKVTFSGTAGTVVITAAGDVTKTITFVVALEGEVKLTEKTITVTVGGTAEDVIEDYNYSEADKKDGPDESIATVVSVTGKDATEGEPTYTSTRVTYSALAGNNTSWTKTGYYYLYRNNYYPVYAYVKSENWYGTTYYRYYYGYSGADSSNDVTEINNSYSGSSNVNVYKKEGGTVPASTTVTFKGVAVGTTYVTIGHVKYTINVIAEDLSNVAALPVQLWFTNCDIELESGYTGGQTTGEFVQGSWQDNKKPYYVSVDVNTAYGPNGVELAKVLPATMKRYENSNTYWEKEYTGKKQKELVLWTGRVHNKADSNIQLISGTDYSNSGSEFKYIRYYGGTWAVSVDRNKWDAVTGAGSTTSASSCTQQLAAYYMMRTDITKEIFTDVADWGYVNGEDDYAKQIGKEQYVILDFAVKQDGMEREPSEFPVDKTTFVFHCTPNDASGSVKQDSSGNYYRQLNNFRGMNTSGYEIYMVTVTMTSGNANTTIGDTTNYTYDYDNTEQIVWAIDEETKTKSRLNEYTAITSGDETYSGCKIGGDPYVRGVEVYNQHGALITYYIRRITQHGDLIVRYFDVTSGYDKALQFHEYTIGVKDADVDKFKETIKLDDPWKKNLIDGNVTNDKDHEVWVSADLSTMPDINPQYRYATNYVCVEVKWAEEGKEVWLYYTFSSDVTFVVDFGLPLVIKPTDMSTELENATITSASIDSETTYADIVVDKTNFNITYKLKEMISSKDTIKVSYTGTNKENSKIGTTSYTVTIIPATNVYYEDSFAKFTNGSGAAQEATWSIVKDNSDETFTEQEQKDSYPNQALEALGTKENVYGYDPKYDSCTMFSMGSAHKVTVTSDMAANWKDETSAWPTAQFTFKGTGFDIISLTDNTSGAIFVDVVGKTKGITQKLVVNNYYGYDYDAATGKWTTTDEKSPNTLYQIPVMAVRDLEYDEYDVTIRVAYGKVFDKTGDDKYSFWLDAVRVYDPMGKSENTGETYKPDAEGYPQYIKLRNELAKNAETREGVVFIDGAANANIALYANYGPNNEVYLANGQAITFALNVSEGVIIKTIQIAAKAPNGAAYMAVTDDTNHSKAIGTATEMYYELDEKVRTFTIANTGEGILSLTNVKITYAEKATVELGSIDTKAEENAVQAVRALFAPAPVEPEPEPEPEKTFEPDRFEASWSRNVMQGRKATLTVKTSEDVEAITVDGQTIRSYRTRTERVGFGRYAKRVTYREFIYSMVAQETADFSVTAINAKGTESEAITARLTVQKRPESIRDIWNWFKGWF